MDGLDASLGLAAIAGFLAFMGNMIVSIQFDRSAHQQKLFVVVNGLVALFAAPLIFRLWLWATIGN